MNDKKVVVSGPIIPSTINTPTDLRIRVQAIDDIYNIELPYIGMIVYVMDEDKYYKIKTLKAKEVADFLIIENSLVDTFEELLIDSSKDAEIIALQQEIAELRAIMEENKEISELEQVTEVTGEELIPIAIDGENKSVKSKYLKDTTDLSEYATKKYVDDYVRDIQIESGNSTNIYLNALDFGLKGDSYTDNVAKFSELMEYVNNQTNGLIGVYFPKGTYVFKDSINIDCSKTFLIGEVGTIFAFDMTNKTCINIEAGINCFGTQPIISCIRLIDRGGTCKAIFLGGNNNENKACGTCFEYMYFEGFSNHITFGNHTFLTKFSKCFFYSWTGDSVVMNTPLVNTGENILFDQCSWHDPSSADSKIFDFNYGFITFRSCSFDYFAKIGRVYGANVPHVNIIDCHIEYGYPHMQIERMDDYALTVENGYVHISNSRILPCKQIQKPFALCSGGEIKFSMNAIRLLGLNSIECKSLTEVTDNGLIMFENTSYDIVHQMTKLKFLNNNGLFSEDINWYTTGGGTVEIIEDEVHGKCFSLTTTSTERVWIESPFIPVEYAHEYYAFYKYKINNLNGGLFYGRFMTYDITQTKMISVTQPFGTLYTGDENVDWTEMTPILRKLTKQLNPQIAYVKIRFEIYNHTSEGANALFTIPYFEKI